MCDRSAVAIVSVPRKGLGVVATRAIPAWRCVASYPGKLYATDVYARRLRAGLTNGFYAVEFVKLDRLRGRLRRGYVIDPGAPGGGVLPDYARAPALRINEPSRGQVPNVAWVWNLPRGTLEFWTTRDVAAGEELLACYGVDGGYQRGYCTPCTGRRRQAIEPELHVVIEPAGRPVPYSTLGSAGVSAALRALAGRLAGV